MTKKAGIFDPYLDTLGGGERYCLTVAEILQKNGYDVDIFWSGDNNILEKAEDRFSLNLKNVKLVPNIFSGTLYQKFIITKKYDLFFFLSDGSTPFLFSKKNILHIQVPFVSNYIETNPIKGFLKSYFFSNIICNSKFTSRFVKKCFQKHIDVLYPPTDIAKFSSSDKKENIILSVGRFDNVLNAKKQDCLIDAFSNLIKKNHLTGWKLVFAGGSLQEASHNSYLNLLINKAKGLPIEFIVNPDFKKLKNIYSKSKIYWHAAGFKVNENIHPEQTEHFGMTIVEAMASGLVPIGIKKGGIPEIIDDTINGFLWKTINGLSTKTLRLIKNPKLLKQMSQNSLEKSKQFSKEHFEVNFIKILKLS